MLPKVRIGVEGAPTIAREIGLVAELIGDLTPTWRSAVDPFVTEHLRKQFDSEGWYGGSPWADYSNEPFYRGYKRAIVGHLKILRWELGGRERLYPSLVNSTHPDHIVEMTPTSYRRGTRVPYARRLVEGGVGPFGERYPGRDIFGMRGTQRNRLFVEIQRDILRRIGAEGIRLARVV